ncbi:DUF3618 domain-containing protein [Aerophototrophica crusticola]|uniref:DUF3618 domain-containing protein n=1 Tax=Aerophototrophica crusticola TaxID=1709002 RepID=A0A858R3F3_9PROT|nr:DUF3618 domain-containing protein [Rhodospirillaceae bacterium B3]
MATRTEEIEREIERTREEMTRTAAEIERRLKPDHVIDSAMGWVQGNPRGQAMANQLLDVVSRNPLPIALIGIGVAWLAFEMTRGQKRGRLNQYTPMRRRMGPNEPASRHHMHVEDGGRAYPKGSSPDPDELIGRVPSGERASDAAAAFEGQGMAGGTAGAGSREAMLRDRLGPNEPASRHHTHVEDRGQAVPPGSSPDADTLIGRKPSGERASEAAEAFEKQDGTAGGSGKTGPVHSYTTPGT